MMSVANLISSTKNMSVANVMSKTSKLSLLIIVLTLFWVISDIQQRLLTNSSVENKLATMQQVKVLPLPKANKALQEQLSSAMSPYATNAKTADESLNIMTDEQQSKQQGDMSTLFVGDQSIELKAVISDFSIVGQANEVDNQDKRLTALLLVTNLKTNTSTIERFTNQMDVYGYTLTILQNTQVLLSHDAHQQDVTLTMYEN
jgi:hypothetical protein